MTLKVHVIEAASDPVAAPDFVGQHWINTATSKQWLANGTATIADWGLILSDAVLDEQIRDVIGAAVQDSASIDFTNNDAGNTMSLAVIPGGVSHDALADFVANEHVNHASVSINAGTGLTGGGDLTATRTISMPNTGTAGTYRSVTTDAQGRVTAGTNPTTLSGYGITDAQPLDSDLTAVSNLAGTGFISRTGAGTAITRTNTASTGITVTNGDGVSGNPTYAISNTGVAASTYGSATQVPQVAINAQGQATSAANINIAIPLSQITQSGATTNQIPQWNGSAWAPATISSGNLPTVTSTQRLALSPIQGQQVYDTNLNTICTYTGTTWIYETTVRSTSVTSTTNNFFSAVPDLTSSSLEVGFYKFECVLIAQSTNTAVGIGARLSSATATANVVGLWLTPESPTAALFSFSQWLQEAVFDDGFSGNAPFTNQDFAICGSGLLEIVSPGTVAIGLRSESFGSAVSIRQRSILIVRKVN